MREIHLAVFDLDNTVWEYFAAHEAAAQRLMDELCRSSGVSLEALKAATREAIIRHEIFDYSQTIRHNRALAEAHPGVDLEKHFATEAQCFRDEISRHQHPYDGMHETLAKLKKQGVRLACYSESDATSVARRLAAIGLADMFDLVCTAPDEGTIFLPGRPPEYMPIERGLPVPHRVILHGDPNGPKTHPEVLGFIMDEMGVDPAHTAMVGDNPVRDVGMARKMGALGIHARWGRKSLGALPLTSELHPYVGHLKEKVAEDGMMEADFIADSPAVLLKFLRGPRPKAPRKRMAPS